MKVSLIFTSTTEHLLENLKRKAKGLEFILPEKNKEGKRFFPNIVLVFIILTKYLNL